MDIGANGSRPSEEPGGTRPPVVVGVDGSAGSRAALRYALQTAARRGTELQVVAAYAPELYWTGGAPLAVADMAGVREDTGKRAAELVQEVREELSSGGEPGIARVHTSVVAVEGPPAVELLRRSHGADLVVVGSRGRGAVRSALLGSVALHCATHASCPMVVVHPAGEPSVTPRVVVGLDGSDAARAALAAAVDEAARLGAELHVVTTFSVTDFWTDLASLVIPSLDEIRAETQRVAEAQVGALLQARPTGSVTPVVRVEVVEGAASDVLVERARGAALLVVGSRGRGVLRALLMGSVALHCAMHAPGPVMVVHPRTGRPAHTEEAVEYVPA